MGDVLIHARRDGPLMLNRPEARNALSPELSLALRDAAEEAAQDDTVRAVLLTGAAGQFCVGGDVKAMAAGGWSGTPGERRNRLRDRVSVVQALHDMPKPVVAATEGAAAPAGLSLALSCDLRICSRTAKLTKAFARVGLSGDYGGTWFLTRQLGAARARELYLTSPVFSGEEAASMGLVTRAVPEGTALAAGLALAETLAAGPGRAYAGINIAAAEIGGTLAESLDCEVRNFLECSLTEDHAEAAHASVEKRAPVFRSR